MRFMVIVHPGDVEDYEAGVMPSNELLENMMKFNEALVNAGVMLFGEGLHPSTKGTRIHFPGKGKQQVISKGPFDARELVGGFWIWEVRSEEEALSWAKRAPMEDGATLELRQIFEAEEFGAEIAAQEKQLKEKMDRKKAG